MATESNLFAHMPAPEDPEILNNKRNLTLWGKLTRTYFCRDGMNCKSYRPDFDDPDNMFHYPVDDDHYPIALPSMEIWVKAIRQGRATVDNPPPVFWRGWLTMAKWTAVLVAKEKTEAAIAAWEEASRERDEGPGQINLILNVSGAAATTVTIERPSDGNVHININNYGNIQMIPPHVYGNPRADTRIIYAPPPDPTLPTPGMDPRSPPLTAISGGLRARAPS
jgi:hypothetical protein